VDGATTSAPWVFQLNNQRAVGFSTEQPARGGRLKKGALKQPAHNQFFETLISATILFKSGWSGALKGDFSSPTKSFAAISFGLRNGLSFGP